MQKLIKIIIGAGLTKIKKWNSLQEKDLEITKNNKQNIGGKLNYIPLIFDTIKV